MFSLNPELTVTKYTFVNKIFFLLLQPNLFHLIYLIKQDYLKKEVRFFFYRPNYYLLLLYTFTAVASKLYLFIIILFIYYLTELYSKTL